VRISISLLPFHYLIFSPQVVFGILSDRYGRKWPLVFNLLLCCVLELGTGFVHTFSEFLAVRSLFGIAMGGIWGLSSSNALENLPVELRGLASGVLQQGYACGYLVAAVVNLTVVAHHGWRSLFYFGACISALAALVRALVPESEVFLKAKELEKEKGTTTGKKTKIFLRETKEMLKHHWKRCIYAVLLMTGPCLHIPTAHSYSPFIRFQLLVPWFTSMSQSHLRHRIHSHHHVQDLYPTYLQVTKGFSSHDATIATIIGNCVRPPLFFSICF